MTILFSAYLFIETTEALRPLIAVKAPSPPPFIK